MKSHVRKAQATTFHGIDDHTFEITDHGKGGIVNVREGTCTCRKWQLSHFPCLHVVKVATHFRCNNAYQYCHRYYTHDVLKKAYMESIMPLGHQSDWTHIEDPMIVLPPVLETSTGRPRNQNRRPSQGEDIRPRRCSRCGNPNHTRLNCDTPLPNATRPPREIPCSFGSSSVRAPGRGSDRGSDRGRSGRGTNRGPNQRRLNWNAPFPNATRSRPQPQVIPSSSSSCSARAPGCARSRGSSHYSSGRSGRGSDRGSSVSERGSRIG